MQRCFDLAVFVWHRIASRWENHVKTTPERTRVSKYSAKLIRYVTFAQLGGLLFVDTNTLICDVDIRSTTYHRDFTSA